jgi:O-antigen ligase
VSAVIPQELAAVQPNAAERAFQAALSFGLAGLGFFVLWSTAGTSISLFLLLVLCCLAPGRIWRQRPWRDPMAAIGLVLLAYIALRTFAGEGLSGRSAGAVNQYHELLMVPLLWALLRLSARPHVFMGGLIAGALFFAALFWIEPLVPSLQGWLHLRRVSAGFGHAMVAFVLLERARLREGPPWLNYGGAAFLVLTLLFVNDGRTGHVLLLLLLLCAAYRVAPPKLRLHALAAMLVASIALAAASPAIRHRITETVQDAQANSQGRLERNSTTARIEQFRTGLDVANTHWLLGTGWLGYRAAFERSAGARLHGTTVEVLGGSSDNPHNEYLLQLGAGGLPALLLFCAWLAVPLWRATNEPPQRSPWASALGCVVLAFVVGCMFNSLLLDYVEGHFFGALVAWLLLRREAS